VWPKLFTLKKTDRVWHSKNTKNCSVNNAFTVHDEMNKQQVVDLCRKFNKAVSTKHLKIENYSVILQKEGVCLLWKTGSMFCRLPIPLVMMQRLGL